MKTTLLAAAALLCLGTGAAYAEGEDGGYIPNTFFTQLPGVVATAPGAPPNNVAANPSPAITSPTTTSGIQPNANANTGTGTNGS